MLVYFERIERDIEILFDKIGVFESIFVIMGCFITVLLVIIIVNAHKTSIIEKRIAKLENEIKNQEE